MKSKYNCPVCGEALDYSSYVIEHPRIGLIEQFDIGCINCENMESRGHQSEHLAYQKLMERCKMKTK